jgi:hypothetical protein
MSARVPEPPNFAVHKPRLHTWSGGVALHRVFDIKRGPTSFNPGTSPPEVRTRFAFFSGPRGKTIGVAYAAESEEGALCEAVFHDVPLKSTPRQVLASRLAPLALVALRPARDLSLVEFLGSGLTRLGVRADHLTATGANTYPETVAWAKALHAALPDADGLVWMSCRFNTAKALVLFADRVSASDVAVHGTPLPLVSGAGRRLVNEATEHADIDIV